jgi:phage tail tape-measure protein
MAFDLKSRIPQILKRDLQTPALIIAGGKLVIRFAHDSYLLMGGVIDRSEFRKRTGGNLGSSAGIVAGAAAGAAAGSLLPGVGNIIGAFAGGLFGSIGGQYLGRTIAEYVEAPLDPGAKKDEAAPKKDEDKPNGKARPSNGARR